MSASPPLPSADLGLAWSVKNSFVAYVARMPDGRVSVGDGAGVTSTEQFYFPFSAAHEADGASRCLQFDGDVCFTAHAGMLTLDIRRPRIDLSADGAYLSVRSSGDEWVRFADLTLPEVVLDGQVSMWLDVPARLSAPAVMLFGGTYSAGERLDPLTIRIPSTPATRTFRGGG